MTQPSPNREQRFIELAAQYDEAIATAAASSDCVPEATPVSEDPDFKDRLERLQSCLRLLERDRLRRTEKDNEIQAEPSKRTRTSSETKSSLASRQIGRFRILRRLGAGGFGVVFLAEDPILRRRVALKIPRPETLATPDLQRRFQRESQIAAKLTHPFLVPVYEAGQAGPISYQVTAYCAGGSLSAWLGGADRLPATLMSEPVSESPHVAQEGAPQRQRQLPIFEAVDLLISLAEGVHYAHQHGILHRDLKPSNILLQPRGEFSVEALRPLEHAADDQALCSQFQPMVADFGLAKMVVDSDTSSFTPFGNAFQTSTVTSVAGTPQYMAPEQIEGRNSDVAPATDVYGLGAILYEVLAGRPVFQKAPIEVLTDQVCRQCPDSLRRQRQDIHRDLEAICLKSLAKSVHDRYATAKLLADDLRSFKRGEAVQARSCPLPEQLAKWISRRPTVSGLILLSCCLVFGLLGMGTLDLFRLSKVNEQLALTVHQLTDQTVSARQARQLAMETSQLASRESRNSQDLAWVSREREYAASMWRASDHFKAGQLRQVNRILQRFLPTEAQSMQATNDPVRGFDWYYLAEQTRSFRDISGHSAHVRDIAISPDGACGYSVSSDGEIRRWGTESGQNLGSWQTLAPAIRSLSNLATINYNATQAMICEASGADGMSHLILWDFGAQAVVQRTSFRTGGVQCLSFSPDGVWGVVGGVGIDSATGGNNGRPLIALWHLASGRLVFANMETDPVLGPVGVNSIAVSPNCRDMAIGIVRGAAKGQDYRVLRARLGPEAGTNDGSACLGDYEVVQDWKTGLADHITFSPDGSLLAFSIAGEYRVEVLDWKTGQLTSLLKDLKTSADAIAFGPNDTLAVATSVTDIPGTTTPESLSPSTRNSHADVVMWNIRTDERKECSLTGSLWIHSIHFHTATKRWYFGEQAGGLSMWEPERPAPYRELTGHKPTETWGVAFSPDEKTLYSVGDDWALRTWDVSTGRQMMTATKHSKLASCVAVSSDGRWIATGSYDDKVIIWKTETLTVHAVLTGHTHDIRTVAFSPDSKTVASAGRDGTVRVWNVADGTLQKVLHGNRGAIRALTIKTDGQLLTGNADGEIHAWESDPEGRRIQRVEGDIYSFSLAPRGLRWARNYVPVSMPDASLIGSAAPEELLLCGCRFGNFRILHVPSGDVIFQGNHFGNEIRSVAFTPDMSGFAVGGDDRTVHIWHAPSDREVLTFSDLPAAINQIAFSPSGSVLAVALHDGSIRLWDAPRTAVTLDRSTIASEDMRLQLAAQ